MVRGSVFERCDMITVPIVLKCPLGEDNFFILASNNLKRQQKHEPRQNHRKGAWMRDLQPLFVSRWLFSRCSRIASRPELGVLQLDDERSTRQMSDLSLNIN
jgi:hypothetical protein